MPTEVKFDLDSLTLGQCEFLTDYTGKSLDELIETIEAESYTARDITAIIALGRNPADPAAEVEAIRATRVSDLDLTGL